MSGVSRHVRALLWGVSGALCALALPVGAADISQAREVAPPPGDRGELLYEVPIAPGVPSKGLAPLPTASAASGAKAQPPRREARDTTPAPALGAATSRQAVKPETPVSAPARRLEKAPGAASAGAARTDRAPGTALRVKEGQARSTVRDGREAGVSRETPPVAAQRAKAKPVVAAPASRAMKSEKVEKAEKTRGHAKAPAKKLAEAAQPSRQTSRAQAQPQRSSASVKAGARQGHARASRAIVAKQATSSKRATSPDRAAAKAVRHTPATSTAKTALKAASKAAPKVSAKTRAKTPAKAPAKGAPKAARHAAKVATQVTSRPAPPTPSRSVKSKKPVPQKSPRAPSR